LAFRSDSTFTIFDVGTAQTPDGKRSLRVVGRWRLAGDTLVYLDPVVKAAQRMVKAADGREVFGGDLTRLVTVRTGRLTSRLPNGEKTWIYERIESSLALGAASTSPCLTDADSVADFRFAAGLPFVQTDSAATAATGLPWARRENIQLVTDSAVCAAGIAAFNRHGKPRSRQLRAAYVFALGGTGYAIMLPGEGTRRGRRAVYVFSPAWIHKRNYLV